MTREQLKEDIKTARAALWLAEEALKAFDALAENNVYTSVEEATCALEEILTDTASEDCEGSYSCGADSYEREFIVDGALYLATLSVEYSRHDKQYYYIDEAVLEITKQL